jgi:hypothetical protein
MIPKLSSIKPTAFFIISLINNFERFVNNTISLDFQRPQIARILVFIVIHLTSVSTIYYAESNGGIFILIASLGNTNTRANILRVICQQYRLRATRQQYNFA